MTGLRTDTDMARTLLAEVTGAGQKLRADTQADFEKSQRLVEDMKAAYTSHFGSF